MPFSKSKSLLALAVLGFSTGALSAEKPYEAMDYGRFFSATFNNTKGKPTFDQKGCAANKGIVVKLGAEEDGAMLFDTDLLRMAGGWTGGFFKKKGVAFDGGHGPNPLPPDGAQMFFETNPTGPGWSKGADFQDPRPLPTGPGAATIPFGPLPHAWAKYRGLYLHGEDVVLSYTVGTAAILEKPGIMKNGEAATLTRTFEVTSPVRLQPCWSQKAAKGRPPSRRAARLSSAIRSMAPSPPSSSARPACQRAPRGRSSRPRACCSSFLRCRPARISSSALPQAVNRLRRSRCRRSCTS